MTDYAIGKTIYAMFSTKAFASNLPTSLLGVPVVSAYEDDGITQITAGITLGIDHDGVTGMNLITVVATTGNGFENDKDYNLVVTTGTVDGVSHVGTVVGTFSIGRAAGAVWDEILIGATHNLPTSAGRRLRGIQEFQGYEGGAVWIDTVNGTPGTVAFENGTVENPVDNLADANTIATAENYKIFQILPGSTINLAASQQNQVFRGSDWILALGGQDIGGSQFIGAAVSGIFSGVPTFISCLISNITGPGATIVDGRFGGTITNNGSDGWFIHDGRGEIAGAAASLTFDFGTAVGNTALNMRNWSGGFQVEAMGDTGADSLTIEGHGKFTEGTCTSGSPEIRGALAMAGITNLTPNEEANNTKTTTEDAVFDPPITAATHNVATSLGRRIRTLATNAIRDDTAQGPGTGNNQIQFDSGASAVDGAYDPAAVVIIGGTGIGQTRNILQYDGATVTATVDRNWKINPDSTSEFVIFGDAGREHVNEGLAQAGASSTITLNALASSNDDAYNDQTIFLRSGTGEDQARIVMDYDGTTKIATVDRAWDVNPDSTTGYVMSPLSLVNLAAITAAILAAGDIDGFTQEEAMKLILAVAVGKLSGAATVTNTIRSAADDADRVVATVDADGNRTAVVLDAAG